MSKWSISTLERAFKKTNLAFLSSIPKFFGTLLFNKVLIIPITQISCHRT